MKIAYSYSRNTDPITSHNAADAAKTKIPRLKNKILACLNENKSFNGNGLTSKEISAAVKESHITISPRMKPLEEFGMVRRTGRYREKSIIWEIV